MATVHTHRTAGSARKAGLLALVLVPGALTGFFAVRSGGFFPGAPALVAAELAILIAVRTVTGRRPFEGVSPALIAAATALALFAFWTLLSSGWSSAGGRAVIEHDRALLYLLTLLLFGTLARTVRRTRWMVYGIAGAIVAVCLIALAARLFPGLGVYDAPIHPERLSHPLTYWNALGLLAGLGAILCGHLASSTRDPWPARVLGAAAVPLLAATLYYTFSRGATWAALLGVAIYVVVGRPRGLLPAALATVPAAAIALLTVNPASVLTDAPSSQAAVDAGREIALTLLACSIGAGLVRALLLPVDRRLERVVLTIPRRRLLLGGAAAAAACGLVVAGIALDARGLVDDKVEQFTAEGSVPGAGSSRLFEFGNNGRIEHWDVALASYGVDHVRGRGAGTYVLDWHRLRESSVSVEDAHSLYLEVLGELGLPGLISLAACLLLILGAFATRARGPDRPLYGAMLAAGIAWAVHAGIDWDWEMPAVTVWLFALGGLALASPPRPPRRRGRGAPLIRLAAAAGCLAFAALPVKVALSESRLDDGLQALRQGDCGAATSSARASLDILGSRSEPFQVIAFCALREGRSSAALGAMQNAVRRDPESWELQYGLAVTRAAVGLDPRPAARRAARLNPIEPLTEGGVQRFDTASPRRWMRRARGAPLTLPD